MTASPTLTSHPQRQVRTDVVESLNDVAAALIFSAQAVRSPRPPDAEWLAGQLNALSRFVGDLALDLRAIEDAAEEDA